MNIVEIINCYPEKRQKPCNPYIIAEAGVNHEGKIELARRIICEAAEGGADAVKFQTYKAEKIASKQSPSYWDLKSEPTKSQFELFKKYDKFWKKEYEELKNVCDKENVEFLSTPFDVDSAKFLNELMPAFKISSSDINNKPFIKYICTFKKPIILSVGASFIWEIARAVEWIEEENISLALLNCVLNYPTEDKNANIGMIINLQEIFPKQVIGYSDHTLPKNMKNLEIAVLLGAKIIEKHFTYNKKLKGNDHYHAMDMNDLKKIRKIIKKDIEIIGSYKKIVLSSEESARKNARRSLVSATNILEGEIIGYNKITWKRPATGIDPAEVEKLIGKKARINIIEDSILQWEYFKDANEPS